LSGDHRKKSHDRKRKDSKQKHAQSLVVRQAIATKDSRQKPQGFAGRALSLAVRQAITT